jgi:hypothetical protein
VGAPWGRACAGHSTDYGSSDIPGFGGPAEASHRAVSVEYTAEACDGGACHKAFITAFQQSSFCLARMS